MVELDVVVPHTIHFVAHPDPILTPRLSNDAGPTHVQSTVVCGDTLSVLRELPDRVFRTVITSPPYWSLRDYSIPGQLGLEDDPDDYVASLLQVFVEVYRVLADDRTLWLNIGDSYTSGGRTWRAPDKKHPVRAMSTRPPTPKELVGIPWRLAFALQEAGWYLRSDVIWRKPNAMPESVKDRPTRSHEYLFFLTKAEQYYYDTLAVREQNERNVRSVWDVHTEPLQDVHFATFPTRLVERCMLLSSRPGESVLDPFFGSGTVGVVAIEHNRAFLGIELNPAYVDVSKRRIGKAQTLFRQIEEVG